VKKRRGGGDIREGEEVNEGGLIDMLISMLRNKECMLLQ
jgi:hypothetical protein